MTGTEGRLAAPRTGGLVVPLALAWGCWLEGWGDGALWGPESVSATGSGALDAGGSWSRPLCPLSLHTER